MKINSASKYLVKYRTWVIKLNYPCFILLHLSLCIIITIIFTGIMYLIKTDFEKYPVNINVPIFFLIAWSIILAPILETLIFQKLPYKFFRRFKGFPANYIFISSFIFGIVHVSSFYNFNVISVLNIIRTILIGVIFAFMYYVLYKKGKENPFWSVVLVHALLNASSSLYDLF
ncbi:MAG: CPBP family intramembrane metalloprotease [Bacteroidales bacterium]|jgi:hypothetical protein|nr:CPBP family intramembrane metalloprotease [Bacteroidales bacterium]